MDPVSAFGLVSQIADLLLRTYEYGKAVRDAHQDMARLYSELLGLKGALEQLLQLSVPQSSTATNDPSVGVVIRSKEFQDTLGSTQWVVTRLLDNLSKKQTSSRRAANAFLWPFVKDTVKSDIKDLERMKSLFTMMMMAEDLCVLYLTVSTLLIDIVEPR